MYLELLYLKIQTSFQHHELWYFSGIVSLASSWLKFTLDIVFFILIHFRTSNYQLFTNCLVYHFTSILVVLICCGLFILFGYIFFKSNFNILAWVEYTTCSLFHDSWTFCNLFLEITLISPVCSEPKSSTISTLQTVHISWFSLIPNSLKTLTEDLKLLFIIMTLHR